MSEPIGPCAMCGHPDARHRVMDAQIERIAAGEHIEDVARDYDTTPAAMAAMWVDIIEFADPGASGG